MLPNLWQLQQGSQSPFAGMRGVLAKGLGAGKAPWELILKLAQEDGWLALYDVSNPNTRTITEIDGQDRVVRVRDSLGNLPDLHSGSPSTSAQVYAPGEFGGLDGFQQLPASGALRTNLSSEVPLPYLSMALFRNTSGEANNRDITNGSNTNRFWTGSELNGNGYSIGGNSSFRAFPGMSKNTDPHVMSFLFNGSESKIWKDGALGIEGSIPSSSNQPLARITWGASDTVNSRFWAGFLGLLLIYDGNPSDAVRGRMENLILSLTNIKRYEIPEALELDGLGLWLDGSDETSLFDDPYSGSNVAADGTIARWEDKSNNLRHARQTTSAERPIRKAGAQNGRDAVRFDGTDDFLFASKNLWNGASGGTIICVYKRNNNVGFQVVLDWTRGSDESQRLRTFSAFDSNDHRAYFRPSDSSMDQANTSHAEVGNEYNIVVHRFDLGAQTMRMNFNGVEVSSLSSLGLASAVTNSDSNFAHIGARHHASSGTPYAVQFFPGDLCEVLAYRRDLTASELRNIEEYLQSKWGTPALPE